MQLLEFYRGDFVLRKNARWDVNLAKELKKRDNEDYIGIIVGTVVEVNPLTISIYGGKAVFSGDSLYVCKNATEYQIPVTLTTPNGVVSGTITHEGLKDRDRVAVIATEDNQKLFVIDKLS